MAEKKTGTKIPKAVHAALKKVRQIGTELRGVYLERDDEIEGLLVALIARQHVLLLGPPGTGKSALARTLCEAVDGADYFQWLLTKFSTPEEVFGPMSLKALEQDQYRRITTRKMPEAHVAFLDECFKANSAILNSLLTLINEREYHNNGGPTKCPLLSCIGASNELPKDESLEALYDRFLLRYWVSPLQGHDAKKAVYGATGAPKITAKITLKELALLQAYVENINVGDDILETYLACQRALNTEGLTGSDRRWRQFMGVIRAFALLRGRTEVRSSDLLILGDGLWRSPDQRTLAREKVGEVASPLTAQSIATLDSAKQLHRDLVALEGTREFLDRAVDALADMKDMARTVAEALTEYGDECEEATEAVKTIKALQADATRRLTSALG